MDKSKDRIDSVHGFHLIYFAYSLIVEWISFAFNLSNVTTFTIHVAKKVGNLPEPMLIANYIS